MTKIGRLTWICLCPQNNIQDGSKNKEIILEPSPMKAVVKKVIGSLICAYIFMKLITIYPIKRISGKPKRFVECKRSGGIWLKLCFSFIPEDDFIENTSFIYKFWFMSMSTTIIRFKYYHAWLLSDAICNNSGLGFNGYEKDGNPKWDLISNINVIAFEVKLTLNHWFEHRNLHSIFWFSLMQLATNLRDAISSWNLGTNRWLRLVVYERVPKKYGTLLTFSLSALWHGFYAGYYLTFVSGALIVTAARSVSLPSGTLWLRLWRTFLISCFSFSSTYL